MNGFRHGFGIFEGENKQRYEGRWKKGHGWGRGQFIFPETRNTYGALYDGESQDLADATTESAQARAASFRSKVAARKAKIAARNAAQAASHFSDNMPELPKVAFEENDDEL